MGDAGPGVSPRYYVLDVVKFREDDLTREATIRRCALKDGFEVEIIVEQEPGSGGKGFGSLLHSRTCGIPDHG